MVVVFYEEEVHGQVTRGSRNVNVNWYELFPCAQLSIFIQFPSRINICVFKMLY